MPLHDDALIAVLSHLDTVGTVRASHVDRHWRSVAVGTASLWRTASLDDCSVDNDSLFRAVVRRSGSALLSIVARLDTNKKSYWTEQQIFELLLQTLLANRYRIRALDVRIAKYQLEDLAKLLSTGFPRLFSLGIFTYDRAMLGDPVELVIATAFQLPFAPLMRRFAFTGKPLPARLILGNVTSVEVEAWNPDRDVRQLDALFSAFPRMRALTLWLGRDVSDEFTLPDERQLLQRFGDLDELRIHRRWDIEPHFPLALLSDSYGLRARHLACYDLKRLQDAVFELLLQKLSADERASLHITLSDEDQHGRSHRYAQTVQPARYQVHVHCATSGRSRVVTWKDYGSAMWNTVYALSNGCMEITVVGDTGWRLLCSAYKYKEDTIWRATKLRIDCTQLPLREVTKGRRKLRLPALRKLVLRAQHGPGELVRVTSSQLLRLLRRFEIDASHTLDVETVGIIVDGDFPYFPEHVTVDGEVPVARTYRAVPVEGRHHREPVEDPALDEFFAREGAFVPSSEVGNEALERIFHTELLMMCMYF